jgi:polyhydroxyalkanoate synthase
MEELFAEQQRMWRRMLNLPALFTAAVQTRVGATPADVVYQNRTLRLLRYRRTTPASHREPLLLCYALVNRPYILDLQPGKSVVERYLTQGFDVYLIDWGTPSDADHKLTIEHYVDDRLGQVVERVCAEASSPTLHLLGYCMGGTLAAAFSALNPDRVATLGLLAAPIDFHRGESLLRVWTNPRYFDVDAFIDAHKNCPAWFLQTCFLLMKPVQNLMEKQIALWEGMDDPQLITNHFAMERWVNDNIPVAGETFRQFVKWLYQDNALVRGELWLGGRRVDLSRVTCPVLLLTARFDHLVPPASTEGICPHLGSADVRRLSIDAGHVGLVVGTKAQRTIWPDATRWLAARSTPSGPLEEGVRHEQR